MLQREALINEPFWIDEPNPYARSYASTTKWSLTWWISNIFMAFAIIVRLFIFVLIIFLATKIPLLWVAVVLEAVLISARIFLPRAKESHQAKAARIQSLAKEMTGAQYLGSALHTAGHPLLQLNQPIVLALRGSDLSIYRYENSSPIHTFSVNDLQAVDLVAFDEDRIPHLGVIDNTAQALQITFPWQGKPCTCSFRRMYKVRPIEWYHAIQKARLTNAAG